MSNKNDNVEFVGLSYYVSYFDDDYITYHNYEFKTKDLASHFIKNFC